MQLARSFPPLPPPPPLTEKLAFVSAFSEWTHAAIPVGKLKLVLLRHIQCCQVLDVFTALCYTDLVCQGLGSSSSSHSARSNIPLLHARQGSQDRASVFAKILSEPPSGILLGNATSFFKTEDILYMQQINAKLISPFSCFLPSPVFDLINTDLLLLLAAPQYVEIEKFNFTVYLYNSKQWGPGLSGGSRILMRFSLTRTLKPVR